MSTYQCYEFLAIDRPLTTEEQEAVAQLSSRVEPHPRRAVFTYHWSGFRGSARDVLAQYYDAMLYVASWGTNRLMLRFPQDLLDLEQVKLYTPLYALDNVSFTQVGASVVLDIEFHEEGGGGWIEDKERLDALAPLREDLLRGDYRLLYLVWLKVLEYEDVLDTVIEPPVPSGLNELSPALEYFVELFGIDVALLQVAAEASGRHRPMPQARMQKAISRLSREECEAYLMRLARGEPHLSTALVNRLRVLLDTSSGPSSAQMPRRRVGDLLAETARRQEEEWRRREEAAERERLAALAALARREAEAWNEVDALIQQMKGNAYDQAVQRLIKLRDLAVHQGEEATFARRVSQICVQYQRRTGLLRRLREVRLYPI